MSDDSLQTLRQQIDNLDQKIVELLNQRAATALQIGQLKSINGTPAYDPAREQKVIAAIDKLNEGPLPKGSIEEIYAAIITACRELQIERS